MVTWRVHVTRVCPTHVKRRVLPEQPCIKGKSNLELQLLIHYGTELDEHVRSRPPSGLRRLRVVGLASQLYIHLAFTYSVGPSSVV